MRRWPPRRCACSGASRQAVERALAEVRDRFKLGDVPVTDTHEAAARAEGVRAEVLAAESALQLKRAALADATGWSDAQTAVAAAAATAPRRRTWPRCSSGWPKCAPATCSCACWRRAPRSRARRPPSTARMAAPSLDLVAMAGQDRLSGSGDYGSASNGLNNSMIGVQLNVPLYTGGYRSAREQETLRLADKAVADADRHAQQVAQADPRRLARPDGRRVARWRRWTRRCAPARARLDATRIGRRSATAPRWTCSTPRTMPPRPNWRCCRPASACCSTGCAWRRWPARWTKTQLQRANAALQRRRAEPIPITTPHRRHAWPIS